MVGFYHRASRGPTIPPHLLDEEHLPVRRNRPEVIGNHPLQPVDHIPHLVQGRNNVRCFFLDKSG